MIGKNIKIKLILLNYLTGNNQLEKRILGIYHNFCDDNNKKYKNGRITPGFMDVLTKEEFELEKNDILEKIRNGAIFIHPTDTIYGIGCNALDNEAVKKVREIKGRSKNPFSIIAPSKKWIYDNFEITEHAKEWIEKLPGALTLILKRKDGKVADAVAPGLDTLGLRIPDHWFSSIVTELGFPIITTSANKVNENFMTSLEDLDPRIQEHIDFIIYEGEKRGRPSKLIDLTKGVEIIER